MSLRRRTVLRGIGAGTATTVGLSGTGGARTGSDEDPDCSVLGGLLGGTGSFSTREVTVESVDGTELAATVYEPDADGPHPAMLVTHGWGMSKEFMRCYAAMYAEREYVVLAYDSRGFGGSGGEVGVNGPNEIQDARRLLDWLADHDDVIAEGDDPRVGMDGASYGGGIQLLTAAEDDRVDAIVPRIAWNDLAASLMPDGTIKSGWLTVLVGAGSVSSRLTGNHGEGVDPRLTEWYVESLRDNVAPPAALEYFADRSPSFADLETPTLVLSGWKDTLFPPSEAVANYRQATEAGVDARLVMYDGGHNAAEIGVDDAQHRRVNRAAIDWVERHVRGADVEVGPPISLYDERADEWQDHESLEAGVDRRTLALSDADGATSSVEQGHLRDETARYEVASDGVTIRGTPALSLSIEAHDAPLICFARLHHVGWFRDEQIDDQVTPFRLEETGSHDLEFELEPLVRTVPDGDALELRIAASDPFYRDERGSATVRDDESTLTLPVAGGSL
ncbi:alpha/beta hydrolase family protein [Halopiger goleimassiliensis]|uniref:alpha/beta hydrolase family protein n=1 Tax=Halopiger goleimassiliensis TaxID=1293048 RepID=UPI000677BF33|nr:CocE/NonD family hydrolase [Halopiger goleimassiliensis]